jgi:hypothetical protein
MIESAVVYCRKNIDVPVDIVTVEGKIESLEKVKLDVIKARPPIWFINASASLHHMPRELKGPTLRMLSALSQFCLITEFESNNDIPDEDTPEFIFSVVQHYGYFIEDVLACGANPEEIKTCIDELLLAESLVMLRNHREQRVDYHTSLAQWISIAEDSNYKLSFYKPSVEIEGGRLVTFTIGLDSVK